MRFNTKVFPGAVFGKLTVIKKLPKNKKGQYKTLCQCECGNLSKPSTSWLGNGKGYKSCGCNHYAKPGIGYGRVVKDAEFGRLTVLEDRFDSDGELLTKVKCRCSCGTEKLVSVDKLSSGSSQSCGCRKNDLIAQRNKDTAKFEGFSAKYKMSFMRWKSMMDRCCKKKCKHYAQYGGRGVKVCEWIQEHPKHLREMLGPWRKAKPSLDRFPIHNGNYSCGACEDCKRNGWELNVRWATRKEQSLNRGDFNVKFTAFGRTLTKSQWAESATPEPMSPDTIHRRVLRGWSIEKALTTPDKFGNSIKV